MTPPPLLLALAAGDRVLTANKRLRQHWALHYGQWRQSLGERTWATPALYTWNGWLTQAWTEGWEALADQHPDNPPTPPLLLSASQERLLWERMVLASPEGKGLLDAQGAARLAAEAWEMTCRWDLPTEENNTTPELRAFGRWRKEFEALCTKNHWASRALVARQVAQWLKQGLAPGLLPETRRCWLAGFDAAMAAWPPDMQAVIQTWQSQGTQVQMLATPAPAVDLQVLAAPNAEQELAAAATWAKEELLRNPEAKLAVVVPNLTAQRPLVLRVFADTLAPEHLANPHGLTQPLPFNISAGTPLATCPLVAAALAWLEMPLAASRQGILHDQALLLLHSPFLGAAEDERHLRPLLARRLAGLGRQAYGLDTLLWAASKPPKTAKETQAETAPGLAPRLAHHLEQFWREAQPLLQGATTRHLPSVWSEHFDRLLGLLGWPGQRALDSVEHQQMGHWQDVLAALATLDPVAEPMDYGQSLTWLRRLARDTPFQAQTPPARLDILGTLEAGGLSFDALWVTGLHHEAWPEPPRPNPFLDWRLQAQHKLPHATAERELAFAQAETGRLLASAPRVILSYPTQEGDRLLSPSPLLPPHAKPLVWETVSLATTWVQNQTQQGAPLETLDDHQAPPLPPGTHTGGTTLFKDQALCPFRAFALHRLHAQPPESPAQALDDRLRGTLTHAVMERVWGNLGNSTALAQLSPEALRTLTQTMAQQVLEELQAQPQRLAPALARLETQRLALLAEEWLSEERKRPEAFTVVALEQKKTVNIGGLEVNTRVDRIDQMADGRKLFVDYKTGKPNWKHWLGPRPEEPQLPLYWVGSQDEKAVGMAFAQVRRSESKFQGVVQLAGHSAGPGLLNLHDPKDLEKLLKEAPDIHNLAELKAALQHTLEALAADFLAGAAQVNPKPKACDYCGLNLLCRIHHGPQAPEEDDTAQEAP